MRLRCASQYHADRSHGSYSVATEVAYAEDVFGAAGSGLEKIVSRDLDISCINVVLALLSSENNR